MNHDLKALAHTYHRAYAAAAFPSPLPWNYLGAREKEAILAGLKAVLDHLTAKNNGKGARTKVVHGNGHRISNALPAQAGTGDDMQRNNADPAAKPRGG